MKCLLPALMLISVTGFAQVKKTIDHTVYDNWRSVGERSISASGKYILYAINPQEGDGELVIRSTEGSKELHIPRGTEATFSADGRYAVCRIKAPFADTRQARIKKKKPDDMPKDSLGIVTLDNMSLVKIPRVKNYRMPQKSEGWLAYQLEKPLPDTTKKKAKTDSAGIQQAKLMAIADSMIKAALNNVKGTVTKEEMIEATQKAVKEVYKKGKDMAFGMADAEGDDPANGGGADVSDLVLRNLATGQVKTYPLVAEYVFSKKGNSLVIETGRNSKDSLSKPMILRISPAAGITDTIMRGFNDARSFAFDEEGNQLAFVAERDSSAKSLVKFPKLWYIGTGNDTARVAVDKQTPGIKLGYTVSDNSEPRFSKDGRKLFFGTAPIQPAKDTNLVDFELARLDVWHYNDDYLQPQQLKQLTTEQRRTYTSVWLPGNDHIQQLGAPDLENVMLIDEGNSDWVLAQTNKGNRISGQWEGRTKNNAYLVNTINGTRKLIATGIYDNFQASPKGRYIYWFDPVQKQYFTFNTATGSKTSISSGIHTPLVDIENDVPDFPQEYGVEGWMDNDNTVIIRDVYDAWKVDPDGKAAPVNLTKGYGIAHKVRLDLLSFDPEKRTISPSDSLYFLGQDMVSKQWGYYQLLPNATALQPLVNGPYMFLPPLRARKANVFLVQRMDPSSSELFTTNDLKHVTQLTHVADQQKDYNWLSAELVKWKMFDGKMSEGILYKPENFDPKKKYPIIFYFYERDADGLYGYRSPAPSASTINIPYFVSNGYLVFDPNIYYKTGEPGQSAYNSVVSAAKFLGKLPYVDSTRMGIQGQSWGGYQVAYLVTRTNIFKAASAGAPVSNMTSAYGGIRWGTGLNRQFQYEKTQSRIGATLWQRPDLYIKNSPLFAADKVQTPLLIMHNDADGAVPWYQGIEYFSALRRLGKKVWLLEYNGEDHNLVERRNRKDLSVRLGQFFDYYLKDAPPARWITDGVPAVDKGRDWGLGY